MTDTMANDDFELIIEGKVHGENGRFAGIASTSSGRYVATVRGQLPLELLQHFSQRKRTGRPKADAVHIASFANFQMIQRTISGRKAAKLETCRVLGIGNLLDHDAQERQMQTTLKKAETILAESGTLNELIWSGDRAGEGRLWMMLEGEYKHAPSGGLAIDGFCWICQFGEKRAVYGRIKVG